MNPGRTVLAASIAIVLLVVATVLTTSQAAAQPPRPAPTATPTATVEATPTTTPTATAEPTPTARVEVVALPGDALIRGGELFTLLLAVSLGGMVLLALMVCSRFVGVRLKPGGDDQGTEATYKRQIEGMVLVMVVVAVILLGVTEKIGQEGLVSVLAAIAGYAVGRTGAS